MSLLTLLRLVSNLFLWWGDKISFIFFLLNTLEKSNFYRNLRAFSRDMRFYLVSSSFSLGSSDWLAAETRLGEHMDWSLGDAITARICWERDISTFLSGMVGSYCIVVVTVCLLVLNLPFSYTFPWWAEGAVASGFGGGSFSSKVFVGTSTRASSLLWMLKCEGRSPCFSYLLWMR